MRFIDLFAGVGGFRPGMERAGYECVWSCEIDRWCQAVYRHRFGETPAGDVRQVDPRTTPDFDVLCAGFPCQSFSVAGKREGLRDPRGTLFYEICRIAGAKRPRLLLLENVKGLLSIDRGETFLAVLQELGGIGYGVEWQVLNSKDFGVPQNRERVFIVGHLGGFRGREVFPVPEGDGIPQEADEGAPGGDEVASALPLDYHKAPLNRGETYIAEVAPMTQVASLYSGNADAGRVYSAGGIARSLKGGAGGVGGKTGLYVVPGPEPVVISKVGKGQEYAPHRGECTTLRGMARHNNVPMVLNATNPHSKAEGRKHHLGGEARALKGPSGNQESLVAIIGNIYPSGGEAGKVVDARGIYPTVKQGKRGGRAGMPPIFDIHRKGEVRTHQDIPPTLRPVAGKQDNKFTLDGARIRRLTPRECERLQGFPDDWTRWGTDESGRKIEISDTQRYKMMGNAVTVPVVEFIAKRIQKHYEVVE